MKITNREKEIIDLVANELTTKEIAAKLFISNETVNTHRKNLMEKLNAKNVAGLVRRGFESGILRSAIGIWVMIMYCWIYAHGQETSIGLEVDVAHDVLFGERLENVGNSFYWSSDLGTLIAGSDDGMGMYSAGAYDLDSIGKYSAIFGIGNKMHAFGSMAWGSGNEIGQFAIFSSISGTQNRITPNGTASNVWGVGNLSDAYSSSIWGSGNKINQGATLSTTWGNFNIVNAPNSTVWGLENIANSTFTSAWGKENVAGGYASTVMGEGNIAKGYTGVVMGLYNDSILVADQSGFFSNTPLLIVGNGTGHDVRSNALSVFGSGFVKIGSGVASADLHIKQSTSTDGPGTGGIILENSNDNAAVPNWQIYNSGSEISFAYGDIRRAYINSFGSFVDSQDFVQRLDPITKSRSLSSHLIQQIAIGTSSQNKSRKEVALDATQFLKNFPNMVIYDEAGEPFGIDYRQLYLTAIAALQEEIKVNEKQQTEIDSLKAIVFNQ